jgi:hypothetical protein
MIKLLATGVWICAVALASVYFSVQLTNKKEPVQEDPAMFGGLETVRGEVTSIPVISSGAVQGYFLTRLSYTIDPAKIQKLDASRVNGTHHRCVVHGAGRRAAHRLP